MNELLTLLGTLGVKILELVVRAAAGEDHKAIVSELNTAMAEAASDAADLDAKIAANNAAAKARVDSEFK